MILNGLPWKQTEIILSFLRLHPSTAFLTLLLTMMASPFLARVNVDILAISELKWTGMGEFNSDDHYIYYSGQESLRRNGVAIMFKK